MRRLKEQVDQSTAAARDQRGICIFLTGEGKAKSSSAFGMVMRSLGHGLKVGIVQFIKGEQLSGEELYIRDNFPDIPFYQMGTGFTWNTQDREGDMQAAKQTWKHAEQLLANPAIDLLVLDELTYMLAFDYLDEKSVISAIRNRPSQQSVVITGRGGGSALRELADTVSEVKNIKHAFEAGISARAGVDY